MDSIKRLRTHIAAITLWSVWVGLLGTSLIWIVVGICQYYDMELKGGDWLQAAASLTGVAAAIFIANSQMRRDSSKSDDAANVALTALIQIANLSGHYVSGLYEATSPNSRSQWHIDQVSSLHRTLMAIDLLKLPNEEMVKHVIHLRGLIEYALHNAELTVSLVDMAAAIRAKNEISGAAFTISGVALNLKVLTEKI